MAENVARGGPHGAGILEEGRALNELRRSCPPVSRACSFSQEPVNAAYLATNAACSGESVITWFSGLSGGAQKPRLATSPFGEILSVEHRQMRVNQKRKPRQARSARQNGLGQAKAEKKGVMILQKRQTNGKPDFVRIR
jgi:hypothetical protein